MCNIKNLITTILIAIVISNSSFAKKTFTAKGFVFNDRNKNNIKENSENPIAKIGVSNGTDVVLTDANGFYQLPIDEDDIIFVIKPTGWMTKTDSLNLPRFYYIHKPAGSPELQHKGIAPTGDLPEYINFGLYKNDEPEKFDVLLFGDPQIRNNRDLGYFYHDAIDEVYGSKAAFGVTLGDICFDNLSMFNGINQAVALLGINWYNIAGNHDINYDAIDDAGSLDTYKRIYGPAYYSFNYAQVHFVILDNIIAKKNKDKDKNWLQYDEGLTDQQLEFVKNDLKFVSKDRLIVVMGHSCITRAGWRAFGKNRTELLEELAKFPHTLSIAGHEHIMDNDFVKTGKNTHHAYVAGAVCGSWWYGWPNEIGVPQATMRDGTPNCYSIATFNGNNYSVRYKAFGRNNNYQMRINLPDEIKISDSNNIQIIVNVFDGSKKNIVETKIDHDGRWKTMLRQSGKDPFCLWLVNQADKYNIKIPDWAKTNLPTVEHLWVAAMPKDLSEGTHIIFVRTTDMYGQKYESQRVFRVVK